MIQIVDTPKCQSSGNFARVFEVVDYFAHIFSSMLLAT